MPPKEITELKDAIRATHGCESLHVESVTVKEVFEDQVAWEGMVGVFDLVGHLEAKRTGYAGLRSSITSAVEIGFLPPQAHDDRWPAGITLR